MLLSETVRPQIHDLLQLDLAGLQPACMDAPNWVRQALASCPWVVVRRAPAPAGQIAAGVRGCSRSERWGCLVSTDLISRAVSLAELLAIARSAAPSPRIPPFNALQRLVERWCDLSLPWGPTGSVGFELATGRQTTTDFSDLDIAIRAEERISVEQARLLWESALRLQTKVDIRVETLECGFSLEEYARAPSPILLRYPDRVQFGCDPWAKALQAMEGVE
jgi:phosphoribosyl-dephospho-CoA transferase